MNENTCKICHKSFSSQQELQGHERNAHGTGNKEQSGPGSEQRQPPQREEKIAS